MRGLTTSIALDHRLGIVGLFYPAVLTTVGTLAVFNWIEYRMQASLRPPPPSPPQEVGSLLCTDARNGSLQSTASHFRIPVTSGSSF